MRTALVLLASFVAFVAMEGAVFRTGLYSWILNPDASTGDLQTILRTERERPKDGPQVLGIGDSRMLLLPRISNQHTAETGYTFGTIATAGVTPRTWYYMLRDIDPTARFYRAIVLAAESYDDAEKWEVAADRASDLNYIIGSLHPSDLWEFSRSYQDPELEWRAARGILFTGLVYKRDLEDLLLHPVSRYRLARVAHRDAFFWHYDYTGSPETVANFHVDWRARKLDAPPNAEPRLVQELSSRLLDPLPPDAEVQSRYMKHWIGKIGERYRGSPTRLIFLRLPRGGFVRPDQPRYNPQGSIRQLAGQPNVTLIDEHFFDSLEKPELFADEMHLNGPGMDLFSIMLTQEVSRILGPPR